MEEPVQAPLVEETKLGLRNKTMFNEHQNTGESCGGSEEGGEVTAVVILGAG